MARVRDYKAEYARRIARGLARGLTRAQARGHPEAGKPLISGRTTGAAYNPRLEEGVKLIRGGQSLSAAAKTIHADPGTLRSYAAAQGVGEKVGGRWRMGEDTRIREMPVLTAGREITVRVKGYETSKLIGDYWEAVKKFLASNDPSHLDSHRGVSFADAEGRRHIFETDENTIYRLNLSGDDPFENVYRIVQ